MIISPPDVELWIGLHHWYQRLMYWILLVGTLKSGCGDGLWAIACVLAVVLVCERPNRALE